jgi:hypothetical protein
MEAMVTAWLIALVVSAPPDAVSLGPRVERGFELRTPELSWQRFEPAPDPGGVRWYQPYSRFTIDGRHVTWAIEGGTTRPPCDPAETRCPTFAEAGLDLVARIKRFPWLQLFVGLRATNVATYVEGDGRSTRSTTVPTLLGGLRLELPRL